jgi:hypothetical protein
VTRNEFIDNITEWSELIDLCREYGCEYCDDVYSEYSRDETINDELVDMARNCDDWTELLDTLRDIPTGYDYYTSSSGDWYGTDNGDDKFESYKNDVYEWMDARDYFEEEESPEDEDEDEEDEDISAIGDETISLDELFSSANNQLKAAEGEEIAARTAEDNEFSEFTSSLQFVAAAALKFECAEDQQWI